MIIGMDFGTTNSGLAFYDGQALHPIPLDPASPHRVVDRTALYLTHAHTIATGQQAIERYLAHNVGRPVKMERVRVGTIAVTAAEIGTYYRDVHILSDTLAPGRLFTSFKTFLASPHYEGTVVGGLAYALDDIVATYLQVARMRAERALGREVASIVLGRPVRFSTDPTADVLARDRLVAAAETLDQTRPASRSAAVAAVDAGFLSAWVTAQEQAGAVPAAQAAVTWVTRDYHLHAWEVPSTESPHPLAHDLGDLAGRNVKQALLTELDARLVVLTSAYRCVLTTPRQLLVLAEAGLELAHLYGFDRGEVICAIGAWERIRIQERLAIVGARGLLWVVDMERARSRLDRSIPFRLQTSSTTDPVALVGLAHGQHLALVTQRGRALRRSTQGVPSQGVQAVKCDAEDRIVACLAVQEGDYLLLMGGDGSAWVVPSLQIPLITAPNTRAPLVAPRVRVQTAAVSDPGTGVWLLTSRYVRRLPDGALAAAPAVATALGRLLALESGEDVAAVVTAPEVVLPSA